MCLSPFPTIYTERRNNDNTNKKNPEQKQGDTENKNNKNNQQIIQEDSTHSQDFHCTGAGYGRAGF